MSISTSGKPFQNARPRAEWKKPVRSVFGRVVKALDVSTDPANPTLKRFVFEQKPDGIHVRRLGTPRKREVVVPFSKLANFHRRQPELFG